MSDLPPNALTVEDILAIQEEVVCATGGARGVLHPGVIESAVARPYQAVFGVELYPSPFDKAAAMAQTIAHDHPFRDGNKRTAMQATAELLWRLGWDLPLEEDFDEAERVVLDLATAAIGWEAFSAWLRTRARPLPKPEIP
ncbi:MAG: type II toxin-antitoxin system death-on-curing family toxin [Armatimonadetes bacterium]|nr:type II toxin-antitoxin system death-on-curing family toxin [Armatimonadota bacterium]